MLTLSVHYERFKQQITLKKCENFVEFLLFSYKVFVLCSKSWLQDMLLFDSIQQAVEGLQ